MSKHWIDDSLTEVVDRSEFWNRISPMDAGSSLGYLWQKDVFPGPLPVLPLPEDAWCRIGLVTQVGGFQIICLDPSSERVVATLRDDLPLPLGDLGQELNIVATAMNDMISFQGPSDKGDPCAKIKGKFAKRK